MSTAVGLPVALVCDDRPVVRHVLARLLLRHGLNAAEASGRQQLETEARRLLPPVVVLALPVAGAVGMDAVRAVVRAVPSCSVVVLSPFVELAAEALEAGAAALLEEHDLPGLEVVLRTLPITLALPDTPTAMRPRQAGAPAGLAGRPRAS